jgi:hypothetical protein
MDVRLTLTGTAPLLVHNVRLADPLDEVAKEMKLISSKRKKTEDDYVALARLEFSGGLYLDSELGPYVPGANVEKSLVEGARITKQGKQVERGVFVSDNVVPILYAGPRDQKGLLADANFRHVASVRVGQNRVMRTRPRFAQWTLEANATVDPSLIEPDALEAIANDAGQMVGLGDYRPRFGRYTADVTVISD